MNEQALSKTTAIKEDFSEHLETTLQAFRTAIIELILAIGADPSKPQDLARQLGISRNLTWKLSKVVGGVDLFAVVPHIPGAAAFRIFFAAMAKAGAPEHLIVDARNAVEEFDRVVKVHTGDRNTLEIMISDRLPASAQSEQIEQSRKLAFQGNSGTWGVRAHVQCAMHILAPNADDPDMADLVQVAGLVGFRRLRPNARWLLFRRERWADDDPHPARDIVESLDPDFPADKGVPLLGEYCSKPIPKVDVIPGEGEDQYELPPGPVGNTAAFTCVYGQVMRKVGNVYGEREGELSEIGCNLITPTEHFLFDLLVHRDFDWAMDPKMVVYSRMDGGAMHMAARRERNHLTTAEPVSDLGFVAGALATPLVPRYSALVRGVFDRLGWDAGDFRVFRLVMAYPPIPTVAIWQSTLPVRPGKVT